MSGDTAGSAGRMFRAVNVRQTAPKADPPSAERESRVPMFLRDVIRADPKPLTDARDGK